MAPNATTPAPTLTHRVPAASTEAAAPGPAPTPAPAPVADGEFAEEEHDLFEPEDKPASLHWGEIVWYNVIILASWHVGAVYALLFVMPKCSLAQLAVLWIAFWVVSGLGITAGAHRLWSHRAYKAKLPLRVFLMLVNSMAFEGSIFEWSRDHRVHHKGSDTTADPHNSGRGLFFSHMGWVMCRKHQNVFRAAKKLDFSDLLADPVVAFQKKYYLSTVFLMCYAVPTAIGYAMGNTWAGFWVGGIFRHVWVLHMTWMVNSVAHFFGYRPYDRNIRAAENLIVAIGAIGEGYHNYHHKYPADYATSEWGLTSGQFNPTKAFIDACAFLGLAYDLKRSRTAAATRERLAIKVHEEMLKQGISEHLSFFDRTVGRLFFGRSQEQILH